MKAAETAQQVLERIRATWPHQDEEFWLREAAAEKRLRQERFDELRSCFPKRWRSLEAAESAPERSVYLHGTVGTGKTHRAVQLALAAATVPAEWQDWVPARWCSTPRWLADTRASFNGGPAANAYGYFTQTGLLVIDDLGVEKGSEWAQEAIYCLVDAAYERETLCIITSNLSLSDLSKRIGARVASRIAEMCDLVDMSGSDRRVQKAREVQ